MMAGDVSASVPASIIQPPWFPRLAIAEGAEGVWFSPDPMAPDRFLIFERASGIWAVVERERVLALHFIEGRDSDACAEAAEELIRADGPAPNGTTTSLIVPRKFGRRKPRPY